MRRPAYVKSDSDVSPSSSPRSPLLRRTTTTATLPFALFVNPVGSPVHVGVRPGRDALQGRRATLRTRTSGALERLYPVACLNSDPVDCCDGITTVILVPRPGSERMSSIPPRVRARSFIPMRPSFS